MQRLLGLCGLILGAVAHHGVPLGQVEVECDQGAMLHAQGPQSGPINLEHNNRRRKGENNANFSHSLTYSHNVTLFLHSGLNMVRNSKKDILVG